MKLEGRVAVLRISAFCRVICKLMCVRIEVLAAVTVKLAGFCGASIVWRKCTEISEGLAARIIRIAPGVGGR